MIRPRLTRSFAAIVLAMALGAGVRSARAADAQMPDEETAAAAAPPIFIACPPQVGRNVYVSGGASLAALKSDEQVALPRIVFVTCWVRSDGDLRAAGASDVPLSAAEAAQEQAVLDNVMRETGANMIMWHAALLAGSSHSDATSAVFAELAPRGEKSSPVSATIPISHPLVASMAELRGKPAWSPSMRPNAAVRSVMNEMLRQSGYDGILDRDFIVLGTIDCDITKQIAMRIAGRDAAPRNSLPDVHVASLDRVALLKKSLAGQAIAHHVRELTDQAEAELQPENIDLKSAEALLQAQSRQTDPDDLRSQRADLEGRQAAFKAKLQDRQSRIQVAVGDARERVEEKLGPILQSIMAEHGVNLLVDRAAILSSATDIDVTDEAIQRLDGVLPDVPLKLPPAPAAQ